MQVRCFYNLVKLIVEIKLINKITISILLCFFISSCTKNNQEPLPTKTRTSLADALKKTAEESSKKMSPSMKATVKRATSELIESNILSKALKKGDMLPEFTLTDFKHGSISSKKLLEKGPIIITFYRGGWCPYCNLQLRDLQLHLKSIKKAGAQLVAISPEKPDSTAKTIEKNKLDFYVLSDANGAVSKKFGLIFTMNDDLIELYKKFGINLEENNNSDKWELPLAATYIVNQSGQIEYSFVNADYTKRAETTELVKIIKSL